MVVELDFSYSILKKILSLLAFVVVFLRAVARHGSGLKASALLSGKWRCTLDPPGP